MRQRIHFTHVVSASLCTDVYDAPVPGLESHAPYSGRVKNTQNGPKSSKFLEKIVRDGPHNLDIDYISP